MQLGRDIVRTAAWLRHQLTAWNTGGEGIHSPYLFHWVRHCLYDNNRYYAFEWIEKQRSAMMRSPKVLDVKDYGTGRSRSSLRRIRDIAAGSLEKRRNAQILFRLVSFLGDRQWNGNRNKPLNIIELGTSLGITTAYLSSPSSANRVLTLEGSGELIKVAQDNWKQLNLNNIVPVPGNINDTLLPALRQLGQIDLAFIDANHTEEATLRYWETIISFVHKKSVLVIDDIHWSRQMERAWNTIRNDRRGTCTMDLYDMGLVFFDPSYLRRHFRLRV